MSAPTLVQYAETAWNTSGSKSTPSISWQSGDIIVVVGGAESANTALGAPTATGLTFTSVTGQVGSGTSQAESNVWSVTAASSGSSTVSGTGAGGARHWGFGVWVWRGSAGLGNHASNATTGITLSLTTAGNNSAVVMGTFDWNEVSPTGYSWTPTVSNDRQHLDDSGRYTVYVADWDDRGTAGTTSYGISGVSGTACSAVILEIKGSAVASFTGTGNVAASKATASGAGTEEFSGSGNAQDNKVVPSGTGTIPGPPTGTGAISASKTTSSGSGSEEFSGSGSPSANKTTASGSGTNSAAGSSESLFGQPSPPTGSSLQADPTAYTMGVQFSSSVDGTLDGIWFYSAAGAAGLPSVIALYTVTGPTLVTSETPSWSGAAGSGWVLANFASPPSITSGTQYKACVFDDGIAGNWYSDTGHYWDTGAGASGITNGDLTAPNNAGADGGQDTFNVATSLAYPGSSFNASNYWIDVSFSPSGAISGTGSITVSKPVLDGSGSVPITITGSGGILVGHRNMILDEAGSSILDESGAVITDEGTSRIVSASGSGTSGGVSGTGNISVSKVQPSGTGTEEFGGSGSPSAKKAELLGSGSLGFAATADIPVNKTTFSGSGTSAGISGTGSASVKKTSITSNGIEEFAGTGDVSVSKATVTGSALAGAIGTGAITAHKPSVSGSGQPAFSGTGDIQGKKATASGAGSLAFVGTGNAETAFAGTSGTGVETFTGSGAVTASKVTVFGSGTPTEFGTGNLSVSKSALSGAGSETFTGSGSPTVSKPSVSGTGNAPLSVSGTGDSHAKKISGAGTGIEEFSGSGGIAAHRAAMSAVGSFGSQFGSGGLTIKIPVAGGDGAESYIASGGPTLKKFTGFGEGTLEISGSGTVQAKKAEFVGISQVFGTSHVSGQSSASGKLTGASNGSSVVGTSNGSSKMSGRA